MAFKTGLVLAALKGQNKSPSILRRKGMKNRPAVRLGGSFSLFFWLAEDGNILVTVQVLLCPRFSLFGRNGDDFFASIIPAIVAAMGVLAFWPAFPMQEKFTSFLSVQLFVVVPKISDA
jgi:hypothetical protein